MNIRSCAALCAATCCVLLTLAGCQPLTPAPKITPNSYSGVQPGYSSAAAARADIQATLQESDAAA